MSFLKEHKNGYFFIYEDSGYTDFGRKAQTIVGTVKYICRQSTSNDLSRQVPEVGPIKGRELLCEASCPVLVDSLIQLYDRKNVRQGNFKVVGLDEGELTGMPSVKRIYAVHHSGSPEL